MHKISRTQVDTNRNQCKIPKANQIAKGEEENESRMLQNKDSSHYWRKKTIENKNNSLDESCTTQHNMMSADQQKETRKKEDSNLVPRGIKFRH